MDRCNMQTGLQRGTDRQMDREENRGMQRNRQTDRQTEGCREEQKPKNGRGCYKYLMKPTIFACPMRTPWELRKTVSTRVMRCSGAPNRNMYRPHT